MCAERSGTVGNWQSGTRRSEPRHTDLEVAALAARRQRVTINLATLVHKRLVTFALSAPYKYSYLLTYLQDYSVWTAERQRTSLTTVTRLPAVKQDRQLQRR